MREAVDIPQSPLSAVETPYDLPAPQPHLPLRKASVEKLQKNRPSPVPLWAHNANQYKGFNPSPVQPLPQMNNVNASSEHAFAGKDRSKDKRPFKPPMGVLAIKQAEDIKTEDMESAVSSPIDGSISRPPSSPMATPPISPRKTKNGKLRSTKSVGEGLRKLGFRMSSPNRPRTKQATDDEIIPKIPFNPDIRSSAPVMNRDSHNAVPFRPTITKLDTDDFIRTVMTGNRSAVTSNSSLLQTSSPQTDQESITRASSHTSDFVHVYPEWPATTPDVETDDEMTVEDAIGMYADGFESSARPSLETEKRNSFVHQKSIEKRKSLQEVRPSSQHSEKVTEKPRPKLAHRRSQSASLLLGGQKKLGDDLPSSRAIDRTHTFSRIMTKPIPNGNLSSRTSAQTTSEVPRDRYGFKKASHHITAEQYDTWDAHYSFHLERRRKKWHLMMKSYGLSTDDPFRFPPKSDKIKRFVRKGIPPEFRGAAWFWYAGGPSMLKKEPGLYHKCLAAIKDGKLTDNDREHIERDLNRTFPDNVKFKPDPSTMMDAQAGAGGGDETAEGGRKSNRHSVEPETPILQALRRVLQAFAVHNPYIGYCQSLNFIAGLLLLFLDQDEEKAFILLNVVTTIHLPGTHGVTLEGANIDIAVLMSCVRDSLPAIWARLDDNGGTQLASFPGAQALRLPTVSLATTAWFMSLFVGTLPIESVLRIWDCLFFEGSKTLFRIALAILKFGERQILAVNDPVEIFQVVQTIPRSMLNINGLMEVCFRRRGGFGHISQGLIESRRDERRQAVADGVASIKDGRASVWKGRWRAKTKNS